MRPSLPWLHGGLVFYIGTGRWSQPITERILPWGVNYCTPPLPQDGRIMLPSVVFKSSCFPLGMSTNLRRLPLPGAWSFTGTPPLVT